MSDKNTLSQDEIDALLQGDLGLDDDEGADAMGQDAEAQGPFTAEQARMLMETGDEGFANSMAEVKGYVNEDVSLQNGRLRVLKATELAQEMGATEQVFIGINFSDGKAGYLISSVHGAMIASIMLQGEYHEDPSFQFGDLQLGAIGECFNSVTGKVVPNLKKKLGKDFVPSAPPAPVIIKGQDLPPEADLLKRGDVVELLYDLAIGDEPASKMRFVLSMELAKSIVKALDPNASFETETAAPQAQAAPQASMAQETQAQAAPSQQEQIAAQAMPQPNQTMPQAGGMDMAAMQQMMQQMMQMQGGQASGQQGGGNGNQQVPISPWNFAPIAPLAHGGAGLGNMELLRDVSLQVTVELGRTRMPIGQILELVNGSIVELNKQAGEAVELYVQGKLVARGEVVIIDENFGIRITSIVNPADRLNVLK